MDQINTRKGMSSGGVVFPMPPQQNHAYSPPTQPYQNNPKPSPPAQQPGEQQNNMVFVPHPRRQSNQRDFRSCCFLPLQLSCMIIGYLWTVVQLKEIYFCIQVLNSIGIKDENEDDENKNQKENVKNMFIFYTVRNTMAFILGLFIMVATIMKWPRTLQVCAVLPPIFLLISILALESDREAINLIDVLAFVALIYCSYVMCSYAKTLLGDRPFSVLSCFSQ